MAGSLVFAVAGGGWGVGVLLRFFPWPPCMQLVLFLPRGRVMAQQGRSLEECRKPWAPGLGWFVWRCFVGLVVWWFGLAVFGRFVGSLVWPPGFLLSLLSRWHSGCTRCSRYVCPFWTNFAPRPPPFEEEGGCRVAGCCGVVGFVLLVLVCLGCLGFLWLFPAPC